MAYHLDKYDHSLVIDGFENGIADSPFDGISDIRNINLISVPGEASVNFSTSAISQQPSSGSVTSASAGADTVTITGATFDSGTAIIFAGGGLAGSGIVAGTTYWAQQVSTGVYNLYTDYGLASLLNITGTATGTWATINMGSPKYFAYASQESTPSYWMVDATGYVWSNARTTSNSPFYWTYTGNQINNFSNGNGLVYYCASGGTWYMFVFSNSSIDYTPTSNTAISWSYQWNPTAGTLGGYNANPTKRLQTASAKNNSHEALVAPDNKVYYCDSNYVGRWYQSAPGTPFDPANNATYTYDQTAVLPFTDIANCLAPLGNNLLVGGQKNVIYPWDTFSPLPNYPILVAESNIQKMVTVNTNTFALVGNRGRVYYTNGSQAQLYKKMPDHISGTVEPYYQWGGLTSNKNQLYLSALVTSNAGVAINQYGGVWAIDVDTKALRLTNKLSYATYAGYAPAIIPNFGSTPAGTGLFIGWNSGASTYGIDTTISTPYTGSQAVIVSDLIPIGTFDRPRDFERMEYKLTRPLASGESITLYARLIFNTTDTGFGTAILTDSTAGNFSNSASINFKNAQWLQLQAVLNSTASSPSYVRLKEIRIKGNV